MTAAPNCSVCGVERRPEYTCNRAVCGAPRVLTASFLVEGEVVQQEATIPAKIHRGRVEAALLNKLRFP